MLTTILRKKQSMLVVFCTLFLAWLLVSAIHPIQPSGGGAASASKTNFSGSSSFAGFSFFRLPDLNFSLSFRFPNLFGKCFLFCFYTPFQWPPFGVGNSTYGESGNPFSSNHNSQFYDPWGACATSGLCPAGTCWNNLGIGKCPTASGVSGNAGSGGAGNNVGASSTLQTRPTTPAHQQQSWFSLPTNVVIGIIVAILVLSGIFLVRRSKTGIREKITNLVQENERQEPEQAALISDDDNSVLYFSTNVQLAQGEIVSELQGWEAQRGFLKPKIAEWFPCKRLPF